MDRRFLVGMMKDWGIALGVAALVFVGWNLSRPSTPTSGLAPDFTLSALDGTNYTLSDLRGKPVVLNFWATWCGPCRAEIPQLSAFHDAHPDVVLLGISVDERLSTSGIGKIAQRLGISYEVLHDPRGVATGAYKVDVLPTTIVVDPKGEIRATHIGAMDQSNLEKLVLHDGT